MTTMTMCFRVRQKPWHRDPHNDSSTARLFDGLGRLVVQTAGRFNLLKSANRTKKCLFGKGDEDKINVYPTDKIK